MYNMSPYSLSRSFRDKPCRAVIYGRASTEHEAQVKALQNQMQWYDDVARFHPQWNVINRYIDHGITGTQVYKRDAFMRMMEDAKQQKFDLIVTREVCRFARNTVDALVCVRQLAAIGIEVYFVNDNIWTLDGDGELRLTIMATMAQEESRKISERSLAGQRVSREKGVLYGNGNIFGYTRNKLTKQFEIDPNQAETVKMIFDLYDSGMGETLVAKELTRLGRKNGVGKVKWDAGKVSKIIKRKNYLGYTVYGYCGCHDLLQQKRGTYQLKNTADGLKMTILTKPSKSSKKEYLYAVFSSVLLSQVIAILYPEKISAEQVEEEKAAVRKLFGAHKMPLLIELAITAAFIAFAVYMLYPVLYSDNARSKGVSDGYLSTFPAEATVGEVLDDFFANGTWENYEQDGVTFVHYSGECVNTQTGEECKIVPRFFQIYSFGSHCTGYSVVRDLFCTGQRFLHSE